MSLLLWTWSTKTTCNFSLLEPEFYDTSRPSSTPPPTLVRCVHRLCTMSTIRAPPSARSSSLDQSLCTILSPGHKDLSSSNLCPHSLDFQRRISTPPLFDVPVHSFHLYRLLPRLHTSPKGYERFPRFPEASVPTNPPPFPLSTDLTPLGPRTDTLSRQKSSTGDLGRLLYTSFLSNSPPYVSPTASEP